MNFATLEAGWSELPVILSAVGGMPEIVEGGSYGALVPAQDVRAIENALAEFLNNKEKRVAFGKALKKQVERKFLWRMTVHETERLYWL